MFGTLGCLVGTVGFTLRELDVAVRTEKELSLIDVSVHATPAVSFVHLCGVRQGTIKGVFETFADDCGPMPLRNSNGAYH
jgi:hypothetical protein